MEKIRPEVELVGVLGNRFNLVRPCMAALEKSGQRGVLGNRFNLVRPCMAALEKSGQRDRALELLCGVINATSNAEALIIMSDYVTITGMTV
jgi:hypothetical protein